MIRSFTLPQQHVAAADGDSLLHEVVSHTGSEDEAHCILRSLERFGSDVSIGYYQVTPRTVQRTYRGAPPVVWSVRAVRR